MKKNVAIITGGDSGEYEISINSGNVVKRNLDHDKYQSFLIVIRSNTWIYTNEKGDQYSIDKNDFSLNLDGSRIKFDVVFNMIHGTPGEDGVILGYFDLLGIPYTSCSMAVSALTFNKIYCNQVVSSNGIKVAKSFHLIKGQKFNIENILQNLKLPLFVKPNNGGSSVAMSKVNIAGDLQAAIEEAFTEDNEVMVEEFIPGREITCGVFDYKGELLVFPITEIVSHKEFFDYEAKYTDGMANEITPAIIPEKVEIDCKAVSSDLYYKLNCKGVVRFDYIFNNDGLYFLEVNTVPGMSEISIVPQQSKEFGIPISRLFEMMIENVL